MPEDKKPKIKDLTMGAYTPSEKFVTSADGTIVRLDDPTRSKTKEELENEKTLV